MSKPLLLIIIIFLSSVVLFSQSKLPEWSKGIIWYQIFPERFANGDTANDPEAEKVFINSRKTPENWEITNWTSNWFEQSEWEKKLGRNFKDHLYERRYGGDIQGIIDRLDHIKDLGVGAIYINPVFEAVSLHKYDGSSFHHIDINFGPDPISDSELMRSEIPDDTDSWKWTEADNLFLKLIDEVHKRGMKIIIDGVFNHTGVQFWAFQDIVKNQEQSKYKDWFIINQFDDPSTSENEFDYKGWWGTKSLPEFNRSKNDLFPGPKQYVFNSTAKWMDPNNDGDPSDGIDGWRLDVAREVPLGFWKDWSLYVKTINKNSIIIGELWELSPDFISDDGPFDALMNYNLAFAVNDFFIAGKNKISVDEFVKRLKKIDETYPAENLFALQNLLSSHDTERLTSMIQNPDRGYDRDANEGNKNYNPGKPSLQVYKKQKIIAAFQMFYPGAPMIYYGDEIGMWGADDPHCRKPMVWDDLKYDDEVINISSGFTSGRGSCTVEQNNDLLKFYKKIISLRNKSEVLKKGSLRFLHSDNKKKSFVFERKYGKDIIIAAFNLGEEPDSISVMNEFGGTSYQNLISDETGLIEDLQKDGSLILNLEPNSFRVLKIIQ
jgi:glycosidase